MRFDVVRKLRFFCFCFCTSLTLSLGGNLGRFTWLRLSSCKNSATHSYQRVQHFRVIVWHYVIVRATPQDSVCSVMLLCGVTLLWGQRHKIACVSLLYCYGIGASVWEFFLPARSCWCMRLHTGGCTDTTHWKLTGRKIPCYIRDLNLRHYCAWLFSRMFYQLSYQYHCSMFACHTRSEGLKKKNRSLQNHCTLRLSLVSLSVWVIVSEYWYHLNVSCLKVKVIYYIYILLIYYIWLGVTYFDGL